MTTAAAASSLIHGSCTLTRDLAVPPGRVFAAFSDLVLRQRWFRIPSEPGAAHHELDFRVGGREVARGTFAPAGVPEQVEYHSEFLDIVPDERIVFTYAITVDGRRHSISLVTVELAAAGSGTRVTRTEQYVFLVLTGDGGVDVAHLEGSMRLQFNGLESAVGRP
ncbi:SRPBCC domain-containing protein [Frankia sp. R43]|uniref:SRPBCC domain-containing protein n=1 Tax=Frankia sp. R43 TaxID=269536 RepID=UPI000AE76C8E|nr:SRPBCC domain-containing protein [Frankia sp. R43]